MTRRTGSDLVPLAHDSALEIRLDRNDSEMIEESGDADARAGPKATGAPHETA